MLRLLINRECPYNLNELWSKALLGNNLFVIDYLYALGNNTWPSHEMISNAYRHRILDRLALRRMVTKGFCVDNKLLNSCDDDLEWDDPISFIRKHLGMPPRKSDSVHFTLKVNIRYLGH